MNTETDDLVSTEAQNDKNTQDARIAAATAGLADILADIL